MGDTVKSNQNRIYTIHTRHMIRTTVYDVHVSQLRSSFIFVHLLSKVILTTYPRRRLIQRKTFIRKTNYPSTRVYDYDYYTHLQTMSRRFPYHRCRVTPYISSIVPVGSFRVSLFKRTVTKKTITKNTLV